MKRLEKESFVENLKGELRKVSTVIAINRSVGITVGEITKLRRDMHNKKASFKVLKNTLARIAIKDSHLDQLNDLLIGPTALAYSDDPVGVAKAVADFAKDNGKMTILGGVMNGKFIDCETIKALASLPSLDELRGKLVGLLVEAATKLVRTIKEPSARIARVVDARN
jgi:large subunit ribosomal protein L10